MPLARHPTPEPVGAPRETAAAATTSPSLYTTARMNPVFQGYVDVDHRRPDSTLVKALVQR
jgi:hypothetical protein